MVLANSTLNARGSISYFPVFVIKHHVAKVTSKRMSIFGLIVPEREESMMAE